MKNIYYFLGTISKNIIIYVYFHDFKQSYCDLFYIYVIIKIIKPFNFYYILVVGLV